MPSKFSPVVLTRVGAVADMSLQSSGAVPVTLMSCKADQLRFMEQVAYVPAYLKYRFTYCLSSALVTLVEKRIWTKSILWREKRQRHFARPACQRK